ncbi:MAG: hypothetical protein HY360_18130 [Verrucomicrobia bacterium]|nr:hypothetical protein [Verrucomicrobiota bacterium]
MYNQFNIASSFRVNGDWYTPAALSDIQNPSQTILLAEGRDADQSVPGRGYYLNYDYNGAGASGGRAVARHGANVTVCWVDGHVGAVPCPDRNNAYSGLTDANVDPGNNWWDRESCGPTANRSQMSAWSFRPSVKIIIRWPSISQTLKLNPGRGVLQSLPSAF